MGFLEYIWVDGDSNLRSKTRISDARAAPQLKNIPSWHFDGAALEHGEPDLVLTPVSVTPDPFRGQNDVLVFCEVGRLDESDYPRESRVELRRLLERIPLGAKPQTGFEQEYTLLQDGRPLGFPVIGEPERSTSNYCAVGADRAFGRHIAEEHAASCMAAGLHYYGFNAEEMPGRWEFQIDRRGEPNESTSVLELCDHLWLARWILERIGERHGVSVGLRNESGDGEWPAAALLSHFSTAKTRSGLGGLAAIHQAIELLSDSEAPPIDYQLTQATPLRPGTRERGPRIRIPTQVQLEGCGYFEDRRPSAAANPYRVLTHLITVVCLGASDAIAA